MAMVEVAIDAAPFHNVAIATDNRGVSNNYHTVSPSFDFDVWSLQLPQRLPELGLSKGAGGQGCEGGAPGVEKVIKRRKSDTPTKRLMMAEF